jgi:hypothetical protein
MFRKLLSLVSIAALTFVSCLGAAAADNGCVIVTPEPTDDILANPGMGWETWTTVSSRMAPRHRRGDRQDKAR